MEPATQTEVKERPILFSGPMVKAILEGRKTQTRRVIKPQPQLIEDENWRGGAYLKFKGASVNIEQCRAGLLREASGVAISPYGQSDDRLWVRETWRTEERGKEMIDGIGFRADNGFRRIEDTSEASEQWVVANHDSKGNKMHKVWRPSIFMPRWASRITLEIKSTRVERLQDITGADAKAEGVDPFMGKDALAYRAAFQIGWDSINAKRGYSWESNPWVWVIEFSKL